jgi:hypothetical protein
MGTERLKQKGHLRSTYTEINKKQHPPSDFSNFQGRTPES